MMWLKRGCCGLIDLKTQTQVIAGLYTFLAFVGMIYGFVMINSPEKVFGASRAMEEVIHEEIENDFDVVPEDPDKNKALEKNITEELELGHISPQDAKYHSMGILETQKRGIKVVVGCLVSMIVSIMLFVGSKKNKSTFFVPWLTEQMIAVTVGILQSLIMAMGGFLTHISVAMGVLGFLVFAVNSLMIYAVLSHFLLLRQMKQHSNQIINSVMSENSYQTTNYDRMTEDLGREMSVVPPGRARAPQDDNHLDRDDVMYFSLT